RPNSASWPRASSDRPAAAARSCKIDGKSFRKRSPMCRQRRTDDAVVQRSHEHADGKQKQRPKAGGICGFPFHSDLLLSFMAPPHHAAGCDINLTPSYTHDICIANFTDALWTQLGA